VDLEDASPLVVTRGASELNDPEGEKRALANAPDLDVQALDTEPPAILRVPFGVEASSGGAPSVLHPRGRISPPLPSDASRGRRLFRGVVRLVEGLYHHDDIFHMAPAMAFHFFLSLMPLLVFIGYVVGLVAQRKGVAAVLGMLLENLPATTEAVLEKEVSRLAAADQLGAIAAVGFLWIASGGTQGLMQAVERVVGAPRRAWWRQRLLALVWVLATLVAFGIAALGIIQWDDVVHAPDDVAVTAVPAEHAPDEVRQARTGAPAAVRPFAPAKRVRRLLRGGGERALAIGASLVAAVGGLAGFYQFSIAHSRRVRRRVVPGALLAMGLVIIVSWGFGLYVRTLASYTVYYGSLAAIAVLLVWLWLVSVAILVGAELNSQLEGLRD
jgi:membrane protein